MYTEVILDSPEDVGIVCDPFFCQRNKVNDNTLDCTRHCYDVVDLGEVDPGKYRFKLSRTNHNYNLSNGKGKHELFFLTQEKWLRGGWRNQVGEYILALFYAPGANCLQVDKRYSKGPWDDESEDRRVNDA